ncbi:AEC family transporter [Coralliovum pocilloporae]|uniref:AEC family transporter n=1 Tax=Coralliovum pocilloporae TaxID=3066369 RepID=UPI00330755AC
MVDTLSLILPIFGLIALGYLIGLFSILPDHAGEALSDFVFKIAMPLFLFHKLAVADFSIVRPWSLWAVYFSAVLVAWIVGQFVIGRLFGRNARAAVIGGICSGYGNPVLIGMPFVLSAYGDEGAVPALLLISVHLPLMMLVSAILMERAALADGERDLVRAPTETVLRVLKSVLTNPIIIGLMAGGFWAVLGLPMPDLMGSVLDRIGVTAVPLALFAIGLVLQSYGISENLPQALSLMPIKLLLMPALVLFTATMMSDLPLLWVKVIVLMAAAPTGVNAYLMASHFRTGHALSSNAVTLTTGLAAVSMGLWFNIVEML